MSTTRLTDTDLGEVRKRVEAATMGPWWANSFGEIWSSHHRAESKAVGTLIAVPEWHSDIDFIAHARTDIPALLDEVERLRDCPATREHLRELTEQHEAQSAYVTALETQLAAALDTEQ